MYKRQGLVTLNILPIAQYPEITPPTVQVSAVYPGADAQTVAQTVGLPIEQQVNGVDGMLYMSSNSSSSGASSLTVSYTHLCGDCWSCWHRRWTMLRPCWGLSIAEGPSGEIGDVPWEPWPAYSCFRLGESCWVLSWGLSLGNFWAVSYTHLITFCASPFASILTW